MKQPKIQILATITPNQGLSLIRDTFQDKFKNFKRKTHRCRDFTRITNRIHGCTVITSDAKRIRQRGEQEGRALWFPQSCNRRISKLKLNQLLNTEYPGNYHNLTVNDCFQEKEEHLSWENSPGVSLMWGTTHSHFTNTPAPFPNNSSLLKRLLETPAK